jgi:hypothetical protein
MAGRANAEADGRTAMTADTGEIRSTGAQTTTGALPAGGILRTVFAVQPLTTPTRSTG